MRKLALSAAILLGGLSANALTVNTENVKIETSMQQSVYTLIDSADLPAAVMLTLDDTYPGCFIEAAYINEDGEYKITITLDDARGTFYLDADGEWLKYE